MTTAYPGALDSLTNPTPTDKLNSATVRHTDQHANANDAIEAIQATLGINPQGASATVAARLSLADLGLSNHIANVSNPHNLTADQILAGTLDDARLSANVPLLNAANIFTNLQTVQASTAQLSLTRTSSANSSLILFRDGTATRKDWMIGSQYNVDNGFEIAVNLTGSYESVMRFSTNKEVGIGFTPTAGNGLLQFATHTTKAGGIAGGSDTFIHRVSTQGWNIGGSDGTNGNYIAVQDFANSLSRGLIGHGATLFSGGSISDFGLRSPAALKFATNGASVALTIDTSQNATFAGTITGNGSGLTNLPAANLTGTLPALNGAALTSLNASNLSSGNLSNSRTSAFTGDVTKASGSGTLTIANSAVTLAKMANLAANSVIGNNTGSAAVPVALTQAQLTAMLNQFAGSTAGTVPTSSGGTTNFLRADGTWGAPTLSGGVSLSANNTFTGVNKFSNTLKVNNATDSPEADCFSVAQGSGASALYAYGVNASTNGLFNIRSARSDGSNELIIANFNGTTLTLDQPVIHTGGLGVFGTTPPAKPTGFGTPTGASRVSNFPGASATLTQCSGAIADLITLLKATGLIGA